MAPRVAILRISRTHNPSQRDDIFAKPGQTHWSNRTTKELIDASTLSKESCNRNCIIVCEYVDDGFGGDSC